MAIEIVSPEEKAKREKELAQKGQSDKSARYPGKLQWIKREWFGDAVKLAPQYTGIDLGKNPQNAQYAGLNAWLPKDVPAVAKQPTFTEVLEEAINEHWKKQSKAAETNKRKQRDESDIIEKMRDRNLEFARYADLRRRNAIASLGGYSGPMYQPVSCGLSNVVGGFINFKPERG